MCDYCSWISQVLAKINVEVQAKERKKLVTRVDPVIIVHGGAGKIPQYARKFMLKEVKKAAVTAYCDLIKGCCSLDAVERAICHMESKRYFNCAYGGSLDAKEEIVMDAAIMTNDFRAGCVGAVRNIEHPITLAKKILQRNEHLLMVEDGAQEFALESDIPTLPPGQLIITSDSKIFLDEEEDDEVQQQHDEDQWFSIPEKCRTGCVITKQEEEEKSTTSAVTKMEESLEIEPDLLQVSAVGAVAYDRKKRLASGTSTNGESGKLYGNVSAIGTAIGCGIYVDRNGSVSVSGCDKAIYSYAPAWRIAQQLQCRKESSVDDAVAAVLEDFEEETGVSDVGAIAVTAEGVPSISFKCMHFPWAYCDKGYVYYGCARKEKFSEKIDILERPLDCMCDEDSN